MVKTCHPGEHPLNASAGMALYEALKTIPGVARENAVDVPALVEIGGFWGIFGVVFCHCGPLILSTVWSVCSPGVGPRERLARM